MAIDGLGNVIIGNKVDERGLLVFGKFNEFGHFAKASIVTIIFTETVKVATSLNKKVTRNFVETIHVAVNVLRTINKMFTESVHVTEQTSRKVTRTYSIGVLISDSRTLKFTREFVEHLHVLDIFKRYFRYIFDETVTITASMGSTKFTRNIMVPVRVADSITKKLTRVLTESVHVADQMIRRRIITLVENVIVSITTTRKITRTFQETIHISDVLTNIVPFIMKKLFSKARGTHRGAVIKLDDGRDVK